MFLFLYCPYVCCKFIYEIGVEQTFRFFFFGDSLPFSFEFVRFRGRNLLPIGDEFAEPAMVDSSYQPESLDDVLAEPFDDDFNDNESSDVIDVSDDESSILNSSRKLSNMCVSFITKSSHL